MLRRATRLPIGQRAVGTSAVPDLKSVAGAAGKVFGGREGPLEAPDAGTKEWMESRRFGTMWHKWFPYEPVPVSPQLGPYVVNVNGGHGEVYNFCACGESDTQ